MTLYYTGMRAGELLALPPVDVDLGKMTTRIHNISQRPGGKNGVPFQNPEK